jgi:hypothetical protein
MMALEVKMLTQSSVHGVVATSKHDQVSSNFSVEGCVRFLNDPDAMEQYGQLACYVNNCLALGLFAATGWQM